MPLDVTLSPPREQGVTSTLFVEETGRNPPPAAGERENRRGAARFFGSSLLFRSGSLSNKKPSPIGPGFLLRAGVPGQSLF